MADNSSSTSQTCHTLQWHHSIILQDQPWERRCISSTSNMLLVTRQSTSDQLLRCLHRSPCRVSLIFRSPHNKAAGLMCQDSPSPSLRADPGCRHQRRACSGDRSCLQFGWMQVIFARHAYGSYDVGSFMFENRLAVSTGRRADWAQVAGYNIELAFLRDATVISDLTNIATHASLYLSSIWNVFCSCVRARA